MTHPLPPIFDTHSTILILGSFPSVASRKAGFYYHHPQNRFWKVIAALTQEPVPKTIEEKKNLVLHHHIALWDVIEECSIKGSSDASIQDVKASNLSILLEQCPIERIFANGQTAAKLYTKYCEMLTCKPIITLPSTSPANASFSLEALIEAWRILF
jgi:hypoxanthine-DNA glycosylase